MRVPSLKPGKHILKLTVDTKSPFGVLTSQREVFIEDSSISKMQTELAAVRAKGNVTRAAAISRQLIAKRFSNSIQPGRAIPIDKPYRPGMQLSGKVKAAATWYPGKDQLRVLIDVTDPQYVAAHGKGGSQYPGVVELFVCPTGADADIYGVSIVRGNDGSVRTNGMGRQAGGTAGQVKTTWKDTAKGYRAEVSIPWGCIKNLPAGWKALPVEVLVAAPVSGESTDILLMSPCDNAMSSATGYCLLSRK